MKYFALVILAWVQSWTVYALINGQPLTGKPDLVRLEFNNRDSICSGFFISPTLIITAAHCIYSWRDGKSAKLTGIITSNEKKLNLKVLKLIPHASYEKGWATHDLAVINVSSSSSYEGNFAIGTNEIPMWGSLVYFGAGKIDMEKKIYGRSSGEATYIKLSSYVLGFGPSSPKEMGSASIASNDSGSPVVHKESGKVIAVTSQSTAITTSGSFLPAFSISTSLIENTNRKFLEEYLLKK